MRGSGEYSGRLLLALAVNRLKVLASRVLASIGVREDVGLLPLAVVIGVLTALAAVAFHELVELLKYVLYEDRGNAFLYGPGLWMLVAVPAAGGLVVGCVSRYVIRSESGHGVVDVIESVIRTRGFVKPITAVEKILTSAVTIGSGGSTGAEGPIVQIGAAISSLVGNVLLISRHRMPLLVGCGTAAGISSIFHSPIGGVLFTLEVILRDFSVRTFAPVVVASVVASVTTQAVFARIDPGGYRAIFAVQSHLLPTTFEINWTQALEFAALGLLCGLVGAILTKSMTLLDKAFVPMKVLGPFRPAVGGALLGASGVGFVLLFTWLTGRDKPVPFENYPMPAFFGDGYGVLRTMIEGTFASGIPGNVVVAMLLAILVLKILGTGLTLGSGGSGGVIAPALFVGAVTGEILRRMLGLPLGEVATALIVVGMGAGLAAVLHAPLASILIVFELTQSPGVIVPAMLATVVAHSVARIVVPDSLYTRALRQRGISPEAAADLSSLRQYTINHLPIEPVLRLTDTDPVSNAIDLAQDTSRSNFIVSDADGHYRGVLTGAELRAVLIDIEAIPLLTVGEVMRSDVKPMRHTENLAALFDAFLAHDIEAMPVGLEYDPDKTIGIVTRDALMKHYQKHWEQA